ncbi:MAG: hypothetical protein IIY16_05140 [Oscillospiraceae bacterium]|nr:hypothetical protein [Oscillospiraceae bacterium]
MTEKILCPWCGAEMRSVLDLVQSHGGRDLAWNCHMQCPNWDCQAEGPFVQIPASAGTENGHEKARAAALRRYTPPIKPMTLEEVWKEEDPVYVEGKNGALYIGDFYASMSAKNGWDMQTLGSAKPQLILEDDYGKNWRCWSRKPTDEERSAAEWEK